MKTDRAFNYNEISRPEIQIKLCMNIFPGAVWRVRVDVCRRNDHVGPHGHSIGPSARQPVARRLLIVCFSLPQFPFGSVLCCCCRAFESVFMLALITLVDVILGGVAAAENRQPPGVASRHVHSAHAQRASSK